VKSQSAWVALLAALAVAIGVWLIAAQPVPVPAPAAAPASEPTPGAAPSVASNLGLEAAPVARGGIGPAPVRAPAPTGTPSAVAGALPPLDTPLAGIIDALEARAQAGDARAACRLAAELSRCAAIAANARLERTLVPAADDAARPGTTQGAEAFVDFAARLVTDLERDRAVCADLPGERFDDAALWLSRAADAGHPAARSAFATGDWWNARAALTRPQVVADYARHARTWAEQSIAAGDLGLMVRLAHALAGEASRAPFAPGALEAVVEPDPIAALALFIALDELARIAPAAMPTGPFEHDTRKALEASLGESRRADAAARAGVLLRSAPGAEALHRFPQGTRGGSVAAQACAAP
jgi:hypothetical protein